MVSPLVFIIFGATGDLMARKLMPALYSLWKQKLLHEKSLIIGVGRRELSTEEFQLLMRDATFKALNHNFSEDFWKEIVDKLDYVSGFFENDQLYKNLVNRLTVLDKNLQSCIPRFFYLATPPEHYETILTHLQSSQLAEGCLPARLPDSVGVSAGGQGTINYTRILIEKPFGKDLATAQHLEEVLANIFTEKQIYRIDHYLGKETVQNLLAFRFGNGIFEPTWNNKFIDHIQINLAESDPVGARIKFYTGVGALRDVVQNHILEMLSLIALEEPRGFDAESIRDAKTQVLEHLLLPDTNIAKVSVRAQYAGFTSEAAQSTGAANTESFVALKLHIDTPRWQGVPFYIRTGKALARKVTEISLHFKKPVCQDDVCFFNPDELQRNVLTIRIQPDEGIHLRLMVKRPGFGMDLSPVHMRFCYQDTFPDGHTPDAYERLLIDAINGDQTLFARTDGIAASWRLVTQILNGWESGDAHMFTYHQGSMGPDAAVQLIEADNRHWYLSED